MIFNINDIFPETYQEMIQRKAERKVFRKGYNEALKDLYDFYVKSFPFYYKKGLTDTILKNGIKSLKIKGCKERPCKYCTKPFGKFITDGFFEQCRIENYDNDYSLCVNNGSYTKIYYCPMCGRELDL